MKQRGLALLGGACVLALVLAYSVGRFQGSGARLDVSAASAGEGQERFWRLEVELASGRRSGAAQASEVLRDLRLPLSVSEDSDGPARPRALSTHAAKPRVAAARASEQPLHKSLVSGPLLEGWYENGQMHFRGRQLQTQAGEWRREGDWEAWHENGTLHELGAYRNDVEDGAWKWFYENGGRMCTGQFVAGKKVDGWLFWHENGRQMMEGAYVDGRRSGPWVYHHDNRVRAAAGVYEHGQAVGEWTFWHPDGSIDPARTGAYEDGELVRDR